MTDENRDQPQPIDPQVMPEKPVVLDYHTPLTNRRREGSVIRFFQGFFATMFACGLIVAFMAMTFQIPTAAKVVVVTFVLVGLYAGCIAMHRWSRRSELTGLMPGIITGLCLGLLAVGPCAVCYV